MPTYSTFIPGFVPPSLNALVGCHWGTRSKRKRACRRAVAAALELAGVPRVAVPRSMVRSARDLGIDPADMAVPAPCRPACKRRVSITLRLPPGRTPIDPDNSKKALLDALAESGHLVDDAARWCECPDPAVDRVPKGEMGTVLTLEDMEP